ncbi:Six-hairpin glycosidase-like protein [Kockovaella imperatae]|uniref:Six-hairpin glycosidase-like protein n=1 Tax=Kockovaella imperatae TaxID=4999 RepID=A0A1Y1U9V0_9TREE|nr:Six-hairpin glycosidase-like protein [Kockovaella imperatae]ORX34809.1 Six-hairpin glycosidase-like protein [Kockovaella imperatae]
MVTAKEPTKYGRDRQDQHYLVIIDNMMNLDMLYEASKLTGDPKYANVATHQAEKSMTSHVRKDGTTYHVVNFDQKTGEPMEFMTAQGYADDSVWSRGQAWGIYGYAQCALRTGRKDFLDTSRKLADVFLSLLPESGVPWWDFRAPTPCPYDASAATITARGLQMLHKLLRDSDPTAANHYLDRAKKLIDDTVRECLTPEARLVDGKVDWGKDDWETILQHSTINGNPVAVRRIMDHGLVYADYYFVEYGNEALKMSRGT